MDLSGLDPEVREALHRDKTIDIITFGAKSGLRRTTEIWFTRVDDRIIICGTPGATGNSKRSPRDWLANLRANPDFWFCFKESLQYACAARASVIVDEADRRYLMSAPATRWYRDQVGSIDLLVKYSPIVDIAFRQSV